MTATFTLDEYRTAREHAGYSYDPARETAEHGRVRSALTIARAIHKMRPGGNGEAFPWWTPDPDGPGWACQLFTVGRSDIPAVALYGIDLAEHPDTDPYARVIEAELWLELEGLREANAVRGEN